jgi:hypothetical protein
VHILRFPEALNKHQALRFTFKEIIEDKSLNPYLAEDFARQTFETPTLLYRQKVIFDEGVPPVVWFYDKQNEP